MADQRWRDGGGGGGGEVVCGEAAVRNASAVEVDAVKAAGRKRLRVRWRRRAGARDARLLDKKSFIYVVLLFL